MVVVVIIKIGYAHWGKINSLHVIAKSLIYNMKQIHKQDIALPAKHQGKTKGTAWLGWLSAGYSEEACQRETTLITLMPKRNVYKINVTIK